MNDINLYDETKQGFSIFSSSPVTIIGETTVTTEKGTLEQYVYTINGYEPQNEKPFVSLKANISLL